MQTLKKEETMLNNAVEIKATLKKEILSVPSLLLVLESCMLDQIDCSGLLVDVPVNLLMYWESDISAILRQGLAEMNWWEKQFEQLYPMTYEMWNSFLLLGG
jgi:hypothetical protein